MVELSHDKVSLKVLRQMIDALGTFKGKFDKKFNFGELAKHFNISQENSHAIVELILKLQDQVNSTFKDYRLDKICENGKLYLVAKRQQESPPEQLIIDQRDVRVLSDLIYTFLEIKRGKGFDLNNNESELIKMLKKIKATHPYLFYENGNNLVYPTKLGLELGKTVISYNKLNKKVEVVRFENCEIRVKK